MCHGVTMYVECTCTCFLSSMSWWYLSYPLSWEAETFGKKVKTCFGKNSIFIFWFIDELIKYLIITDLLITYLFYFSFGQYLRHLLSKEADIWTRLWTRFWYKVCFWFIDESINYFIFRLITQFSKSYRFG